jgi:glycine/D-amino acid oxidase-like deaminating enzyme
MTEIRDVIIIGGGVIGLSTAYQLARHSNLRITVLEKGLAPGEGSSGASSAVCRHRYSLPETIRLARDGIRAYRQWDRFTGLEKPLAGFHPDGVLWMPGDDSEWAKCEHQRMAGFGIRTEVLDDAELVSRFPAFSPCTQAPDILQAKHHDCKTGGMHLLESDGGWMDAPAGERWRVDGSDGCIDGPGHGLPPGRGGGAFSGRRCGY